MLISTESHGESFDQITGPNDSIMGPAFGLWQIEPWTVDSLYDHYLKFKPHTKVKLDAMLAETPDMHTQLATNLIFAAAVCRLKYYRFPEPMPKTLSGMDKFWKERYNTSSGKGALGDFINKAGVVMELKEN